jgi:hypothetical protein
MQIVRLVYGYSSFLWLVLVCAWIVTVDSPYTAFDWWLTKGVVVVTVIMGTCGAISHLHSVKPTRR